MKPKELLNADYLDIVFDQRNKTYGGYELRKHYDQRLRKAAMLAITGVAAMLSFSFISVNHKGESTKPREVVVSPTDIIVPPPPIKPVVTPPAPPPAAQQQVATIQHAIIKVITDDLVKPEDLPTENKNIGDAVVGTKNQDGDATGIASTNDQPKGGGTSVVDVTPPVKIVDYVEQPPTMTDLAGYLNKSLKYPDMARSNNIEGRVIIKFVVNEDGSVSDAVVVRGIGGGCDEEALRVVRAMPHWKPGKMNGKAVKVYFNLPIVFKLN